MFFKTTYTFIKKWRADKCKIIDLFQKEICFDDDAMLNMY